MYKINNYQEYMIYLNNWLQSQGEMTYMDIVDMLKSNALTERFGLTIYDVEKDIKALSSNNVKGVPILSLQGGTSGKVKDINYNSLLEEWVKCSNKLTDRKIKDLIKANRLNVSPADVAADMREYIAKKQNIALSIMPMKRNQNNTDTAIAKYKPIKAETVHKKTIDCDLEMINGVCSLLKNYPRLIEEERKLKNALADIFPGKKMEVNLLSELVENGILEEIKRVEILDGIMCSKYASILEDCYGTSNEIAVKMVLVWFHGYGGLICNKKIRIDSEFFIGGRK